MSDLTTMELPKLQEKEFFKGMKLVDLAKYIKSYKEAKSDLKAMESQYNEIYDYLSIFVVPDMMDEEMVKNVSYSGIGRLQLAPLMQCSVLKDNKEELYRWLRDNGHGGLIAPTINSSTLKAWVKEQKEAGNPVPEDLLKIHIGSRASVVGS